MEANSRRNSEAQQLLESQTFKDAVASVERYFVERAASAHVDDEAAILENMRHVRALRAVVAALNSWALSGRIRDEKAERNANGEKVSHVA